MSAYDDTYLTRRDGRGTAHLLAKLPNGELSHQTLCGRDSERMREGRQGQPVCRSCERAADRLDENA